MTRFHWALRQHHQWNLADLDELYPWERDLHLQWLNDHLEEMEMKRGGGSSQRTDIPPELMMEQ